MTEVSSASLPDLGRLVRGTLGAFACWVVLNAPLAAQAELPNWTVSEQPRLQIGLESGPEEYLFDFIRGIVPMPEGRLAVADAGYLTVRVYDADGQYLYRMGGPGEGPGEFSGIYDLWLTEDGTLAVWDHLAQRIARFGPSGEHRETTRVAHDMELSGNLQVFFGPLSGGEVLLGALTTGAREPGERSAAPYLLFRYHLSGEFRAAVGQAEGMWRYRTDRGVIPLPFTPVPWAATWNDTIYLAAGYGPGIEVRDRQGSLVRTLPVPGRRTASRSDWTAFQSELRARADHLPVGAFYVNLLEQGEMPFDDRLPAVAGLLVDETGLIWAKVFRPAKDSGLLNVRARPPAPGGGWWVLDPERGVTVARVEMPPSVVPLAIREGEIIGKDVDALGIERVVVHELRRPERP